MSIYEQNISAVMSELSAALSHVNRQGAGALVQRLLDSPAVFIAGAGRSGLIMRCFAMRLMQMGMKVHVVGDTVTPAIGHEDFLIVGSGSGKTPGMLNISKIARDKGAAVALITANSESQNALLADIVVKISVPALKPTATSALISIQPLGSLFEQTLFIFLEAIVLELMLARSQAANDMAKRHANLE